MISTFRVLWREKASRLKEIYRQHGLSGVKEITLRLLNKPLRAWSEEFQWIRLREMSEDGCLKAIVESGILLVDAFDPGISKELIIHRTHEPIVTGLIKGLLRDGMVVIDIGSNIGYYVLLEGRLVGNRGSVVAIEPMPRNLELLKRNIELNELTAVTVFEGAVGDQDGSGTLYMARASNWHSMLLSEQTVAGTIEVKVYKLDTLVECLQLPYLDLIRMDIEGYEATAIQGMVGSLEKYRPRLVIELHPHLVGGRKIIDLLKILKDLGYETRYVVDRQLDFAGVRRMNFSCLETVSIDELMVDRRVVNGEVPITGLFEVA